MEQVLERQVVAAYSSSWFSSGSVPAETWHPWGVAAVLIHRLDVDGFRKNVRQRFGGWPRRL